MSTAFHKGRFGSFRFQYQANVIKTLEKTSKITVHIGRLRLVFVFFSLAGLNSICSTSDSGDDFCDCMRYFV